jgi:hypothetical protein
MYFMETLKEYNEFKEIKEIGEKFSVIQTDFWLILCYNEWINPFLISMEEAKDSSLQNFTIQEFQDRVALFPDDFGDVVILPDELADQLGIHSVFESPLSRISREGLEKQLYFDFDDTLFRTDVFKHQVVFAAAQEMIGMSEREAVTLYKDMKKKDISFSTETWESEIREYAHENGLQVSESFSGMRPFFREKLLDRELGIIPKDTIRLVKSLNRVGAPLNVVTKGDPQFQAEKLHLFTQMLSEDVLGVNPLQIRVAFVNPHSPAGDVQVRVPEVSFKNVSLEFSSWVYAQKSEALVAKAHENNSRSLYYVNDKISENAQIEKAMEGVDGVDVQTFQIQRTGNTQGDVLLDLERVSDAISTLESEDFLARFLTVLAKSKKMEPLTLLDEVQIPMPQKLSDLAPVMREMYQTVVGTGTNVLLDRNRVADFFSDLDEQKRNVVLVLGGPKLQEISDEAARALNVIARDQVEYVLSGGRKVWPHFYPLSEAQVLKNFCLVKVLRERYAGRQDIVEVLTTELQMFSELIESNLRKIDPLSRRLGMTRGDIAQVLMSQDADKILKEEGMFEPLPSFEKFSERMRKVLNDHGVPSDDPDLIDIIQLFHERVYLEEEATHTPGNFWKTAQMLERTGEGRALGKMVVVARDFHSVRGYGTYLFSSLFKRFNALEMGEPLEKSLSLDVRDMAVEMLETFHREQSDQDLAVALEDLHQRWNREHPITDNDQVADAERSLQLAIALELAFQELGEQENAEGAEMDPNSEYWYKRGEMRWLRQFLLEEVKSGLPNPGMDLRCLPAETSQYSDEHFKEIQKFLEKDPALVSVSQWQDLHQFFAEGFEGLFANYEKMYSYHGKGLISTQVLPPVVRINEMLHHVQEVWNVALEQSKSSKTEAEQLQMNQLKLQVAQFDSHQGPLHKLVPFQQDKAA